jgi:hypothetical protein
MKLPTPFLKCTGVVRVATDAVRAQAGSGRAKVRCRVWTAGLSPRKEDIEYFFLEITPVSEAQLELYLRILKKNATVGCSGTKVCKVLETAEGDRFAATLYADSLWPHQSPPDADASDAETGFAEESAKQPSTHPEPATDRPAVIARPAQVRTAAPTRAATLSTSPAPPQRQSAVVTTPAPAAPTGLFGKLENW